MIRQATVAAVSLQDAARICDMQIEFFESAGLEWRRPTAERVRQYTAQPHIITALDANGICMLKASEERRDVQVDLLLPRGTDRDLLFPVLHAAFIEAATRYPQGLDWRAWAVFMAAMDEHGKPDGGKGECEAWQKYYPDTDVLEDGGGWWIESTLERLLRRGD